MSCCGTRYYCTPSGPVAVEPDADGWYEVPTGGTSGWYKTEDEALAVCSPPDLEMDCSGETTIAVLGAFRVTLYDFTGDFVGYFPTTEFAVYPYFSSLPATNVVSAYGSVLDALGNEWGFGMIMNCDSGGAAGGCSPGDLGGAELLFYPTDITAVGCPGSAGVTATSLSPCVDYLTFPESALYCVPGATPLFPPGETPVQEWAFACGLTGTFKYKVAPL